MPHLLVPTQVLAERLAGQESSFAPYITHLPRGVPGIPLFFPEAAIAALEYPPVTEQVGAGDGSCAWGIARTSMLQAWLAYKVAVVTVTGASVYTAGAQLPLPCLSSTHPQVKKRGRWLARFCRDTLASLPPAEDPFQGAKVDVNALGESSAGVAGQGGHTHRSLPGWLAAAAAAHQQLDLYRCGALAPTLARRRCA